MIMAYTDEVMSVMHLQYLFVTNNITKTTYSTGEILSEPRIKR